MAKLNENSTTLINPPPLPTYTGADVAHKRVILRVDLNAPFKGKIILDDNRLRAILPTLKDLIEKKARIILIAHRGRPNLEGTSFKSDLELSLKPLVKPLSNLLSHPIFFQENILGDEVKKEVNHLKDREILLLENLRFYEGEEKNDLNFSKALAELGEVFINDAFSVSHRAHGSVVGLAKLLPAFSGLLLNAEIKNLNGFFEKKSVPLMAIIGGAKISSKIGLLKKLVTMTDTVAVGGGIANTFLLAKGYDLGKSLAEPSEVQTAQNIIALAKEHDCTLILPTDVNVSKDLEPSSEVITTSVKDIHPSKSIFDIGPKTVKEICKAMVKSKTVIWNGPVGLFEHKPFDQASIQIAQTLAKFTKNGHLRSVAGGGETISVLKSAHVENDFTYLSTGGGAFLEYIEGRKLPGIQALTA